MFTRSRSWSLVVIRGHSWSLARGHSWSLVCTFRQDPDGRVIPNTMPNTADEPNWGGGGGGGGGGVTFSCHAVTKYDWLGG